MAKPRTWSTIRPAVYGRVAFLLTLSIIMAIVAGQPIMERHVVLLSGVAAIAILSMAVAVAYWLNVWLVRGIMMPGMGVHDCPNCGVAGMERVALVSFGPRYYRCHRCGLRCKRGFLGSWCEAKSPGEDALFLAKERQVTWEWEPPVGEDATYGWKSLDSLVRNQKRRHRSP